MSLEDAKVEQENFDETLKLIEGFEFKEVLKNNCINKMASLYGTINDYNGKTHDAVLNLKKLPFQNNQVGSLIKSVYSKGCISTYECDSTSNVTLDDFNCYKGTLIYPATSKIIDQNRFRSVLHFNESYDLYKECIFPKITDDLERRNCWIRRIFDGEAEKDRILYRQNNKDGNFVILPDLKWDGKTIEDLYITLICGDTSLYSLRELTASHIPMLEVMKGAIYEVLKEKYNIGKHQAKIFAHYHPSFWQFHLHVVSLNTNDRISHRDIMIETIINNLTICSDYYQQSTMPVTILEGSFLQECYMPLK